MVTNNFVGGIVCLAIAGTLAWFLYSVYINPDSKIGYIDSDQIAYRKSHGTIVEKQITQNGRELTFTYPEGDNTFRGVLTVSQDEFDRTQIGDKIPIFYGLYLPHLWKPIRSGELYYDGIALAAVTAGVLLTGVFFICRAIFKR